MFSLSNKPRSVCLANPEENQLTDFNELDLQKSPFVLNCSFDHYISTDPEVKDTMSAQA
jgi:hypothetical protein